jgi:hypothetical protein
MDALAANFYSIRPVLDEDLNRLLEEEFKLIRAGREVYLWQLEDRGAPRTPIYCASHCACLASRISRQVASSTMYTTLRVRITGGSSHRSVEARVGVHGEHLLRWGFHVVTLVGDSAGGWSVSDPLVFGSARLHSLSEWSGRFTSTGEMTYTLLEE